MATQGINPNTVPPQAPQNEGSVAPILLGIAWSFGSVSLLCMFARLYVSSRLLKSLRREDGVLALCIAFLIALLTLYTLSIHYGLGQHVTALSLNQVAKATEIFFAASIFVIALYCSLKLCILLLISRIFEMPRSHKWALYGAWTVLLALGIAQIGIFIPTCFPEENIWAPQLVAHCLKPDIATYYNLGFSIYSTLIDLMLAAYPGFRIWQLNMGLKRKIRTTILMGLGTLATVMAIVKCSVLLTYANQTDFLYSPYVGDAFTLLEIYFLVYAACIPTLGPMFSRAQAAKESRETSQKYLISSTTSGITSRRTKLSDKSESSRIDAQYDLSQFDKHDDENIHIEQYFATSMQPRGPHPPSSDSDSLRALRPDLAGFAGKAG